MRSVAHDSVCEYELNTGIRWRADSTDAYPAPSLPSYENVIQSKERVKALRGAKDPVAVMRNVLPVPCDFTSPIRSHGILRPTCSRRPFALDDDGKDRAHFVAGTDFLTALRTACVRARLWIILTMHCAWVYILTNNRHTVLYVGVTNNMATRLWEHKSRQNPKCFTARYNINKLIYYEGFDSIVEAIAREKFIKGKSRKWKEALIEKMNPGWSDLAAFAQSV